MRLRVLIALSLCTISYCGTVLGANLDSIDTLRSAVDQARSKCSSKIHFDTTSFEGCIEQLANQYKKSDLRRLGTEYAGFAIALSTSRMGMTGSHETARYFYSRYQPLQKKFGITDEELCTTLAGNCKIRIAQTKQFANPPSNKK